MHEFLEIEFRSGRIGHSLNPVGMVVNPEDIIIVAAERGIDIAKVIHTSLQGEEYNDFVETGKTCEFIRIASPEDMESLEKLFDEEDTAQTKFLELVTKYPFEMKLIETIYQFDKNKLTFFFTAEGRVDFREFVRELATVFRTRIELHQTTGRDEAKRLGGYGMCGYRYCCSSFLKRFNQVTIKMAKDQNLSGNLSKISGPCGRLLCCLHFEENFYTETSKEFPEVGDEVIYKGTKMYVFRNDYYNKKVLLTLDELIEPFTLKEYN